MKNILTNIYNNTCQALAASAFNSHFSIIDTDTEENLKLAFQMRHEIFCVQRKFDMDHDGDLEYDAYDDHAHSFMIRHNPTQKLIGVGRIIYADPNNPRKSFPMQNYLDPALLQEHNIWNENDVQKTVEISRLGILREYASLKSPIYKETRSLILPSLKKNIHNIGKLGLYRGVFDYTLNRAASENCIFATDPFLLKRFSDIGFRAYHKMGKNIDISGEVSPIHFNIRDMLTDAYENTPLNWAIATDNGHILNTASSTSTRT